MFGGGIDHIPMVDEQGHLYGIAVNKSNELRIGRHLVGHDSPAVVVSEIGINHQGSVAFAKELVDLSLAAGADVVKFQLRDMDALYRQGTGGSGGEDLGPQYTLDLLASNNLTADELVEVFDHRRAVGSTSRARRGPPSRPARRLRRRRDQGRLRRHDPLSHFCAT